MWKALFWVVKQRVAVISYRRFGTFYRYHLQGPRTQKLLDSWPLKTGEIGCPATSVRNFRHSPRHNPEERCSHLLRGGSLKSHAATLQLQCSRMTEGEQRRFGEPGTKFRQFFSWGWRQQILPIDGSNYLPNRTVLPPPRHSATLAASTVSSHAILFRFDPRQGPTNPTAIRLPTIPGLHFTTHQTAGGKPHTIQALPGNSC